MDKWHFDAAFGGARRDEEKSRAKERIFSHRSASHGWDPRNQRPELWQLFNTRIKTGESMRVFPLSNWTELDVWEYIRAENIPVVPLYFAKQRPVVERDGMLIMVDDDRLPLLPGEKPRMMQRSFPHARLLSVDRRDPIERRHARRDHRRNARLDQLGTAGPRHRSRRSRLDGEEKARGLFLMSASRAINCLNAARARDSADTRPALRFLTCGSVDDGKSTLIGRLLYEQNLIFDDQLAALERDSKKHGTTGADVDFALLLDGLEAEREQGITIDVAYRYFSTPRRAFVVADTPGHEQYTRNMATGASNADLAVLLVDARKGLLSQTRRHAIIASLLGIRHVVLAVNKIDLVEFDQAVFEQIASSFSGFAGALGFKDIRAIPMSARYGDNVSSLSERTPWYSGPHLLDYLETVDVEDDRAGKPFRMPVQWVNRPNSDFRGFAGTIVSGSAKPGDEIAVLPSGQTTRIKRIIGAGGDLDAARRGDSVTVTLADEIDVARGDMLAALRDRPQVADQFAAHLVWMSNEHLFPGRSYLMKINQPHARRDGDRAQASASTSTRCRSLPPRRWR